MEYSFASMRSELLFCATKAPFETLQLFVGNSYKMPLELLVNEQNSFELMLSCSLVLWVQDLLEMGVILEQLLREGVPDPIVCAAGSFKLPSGVLINELDSVDLMLCFLGVVLEQLLG